MVYIKQINSIQLNMNENQGNLLIFFCIRFNSRIKSVLIPSKQVKQDFGLS